MKKPKIVSVVQRVYALVRDVGRKRLALAVVMIVAQGVAQVVGVTSIFPFLSIATDPSGFRSSKWAAWLPLDAISNRELLLWAGGTCVALLLLSNMVSLAAVVARARYVNAVATHLRKKLIREVLAQPYGYFLRTNSSELYQRIQVEVQQFANQILQPLLAVAASGLTVGLLVATVTIAQPMAALVAIVGVAAFYVGVFLFIRPRARKLGNELRIANKGMVRSLQEILANIKTVMVFDKSRHFESVYGTKSDDRAERQPWVGLYGQAPKFFIEPLGLGGLVALMTAAALSEGALAAALPSLGVLALSAYRLLPEAQKLYGQASQMLTFAHVLSKIERIGDAPAKPLGPRAPKTPWTFEDKITFDQVGFQYPNSKQPVVQDLTVCIQHNQSVGISGPSGSGKSTFVDLLLGLHTPTKGAIRVDGRELDESSLSSWRALVAYVPQDVHLFDETLAANIAFGVPTEEVDPDLIRETARAAQLLDFIEQNLPKGFDTVIGERGARLSGGQRQRVGLARALYRRPEVLVLDEATSALDTETESLVMDALRALHGKLTMVVIAHRLETLKMCDRRLEFPLGREIASTVDGEAVDAPTSTPGN